MIFLLAVVLPYLAIAIFVAGVTYRVMRWARSPVPFRIPVTCGQQKSLPWIKHARIESPSSLSGVLARMGLEVFFFRSLFRNTRSELHSGPRLVCREEKLLWLGALLFHWSLLFVLIRHLRFFLEPVPRFVLLCQSVDGFFQIGAPALYATDIALFIGLVYLLLRRLANAQLRYLSLPSDYFALGLVLGLACSGIWMRYFDKTDLVQVKELAAGLAVFSPRIPAGIGWMFYGHILLASILLAYFPFSKLMHMAGIFLSPTRNLANNNRMKRHVNPWNGPVKTHTYAEWEAEFHDKIKGAGLPFEGS